MFDKTNVDGIMIGRGSLGRPWVFKQIIDYLEGRKEEEISKEEILKNILEHLELEQLQKKEETAVKEMRKHIAWYIKGLPEATFLRQEINKIEKKEELVNTIKEYFNKI